MAIYIIQLFSDGVMHYPYPRTVRDSWEIEMAIRNIGGSISHEEIEAMEKSDILERNSRWRSGNGNFMRVIRIE